MPPTPPSSTTTTASLATTAPRITLPGMLVPCLDEYSPRPTPYDRRTPATRGTPLANRRVHPQPAFRLIPAGRSGRAAAAEYSLNTVSQEDCYRTFTEAETARSETKKVKQAKLIRLQTNGHKHDLG